MVFALQLLGVIALTLFILLMLVGFYSFWFMTVKTANDKQELEAEIDFLKEQLAIIHLIDTDNLEIQ